MEFSYTDFRDAPELHKHVVNLAASDTIPIDAIALQCRTTVTKVNAILNHPCVKMHLEDHRLRNVARIHDMYENLGDIRSKLIQNLLEQVEEGDLKVNESIKLLDLIAKIHPDRAIVPQTKQLNEGSGGKMRGVQLEALRARAQEFLPPPVNVTPFTKNNDNVINVNVEEVNQLEVADG
jgi:hypothetical protein